MGKGGGSAQIEVNKYHLSQHFGICAQADALLAITVKEKLAWSGRITSLDQFALKKGSLFGGEKKEGGVKAVVTYLPGASDQVLPDELAQKLGRADGNDCPGFRGLASIFFTGPKGTAFVSSWNSGDSFRKQRGAYWAANNPYLPGVWCTVERAPVGLDPDYAMVPRLGAVDAIAATTVINVAAEDFTGTAAERTTTITAAALDTVIISKPLVADDDRLEWDAWSAWTADDEVTHDLPVPGQTWSNEFQVYGDTGGADTLLFDPTLDANLYETAADAYAALSPQLPVEFTGYTNYKIIVPNDPNPTGNRNGLSLLFQVATRGPDANPAHIIYECLTNTDWGMGSPTTAIDTDAFEEAAVTLYSENFGLSMIWTRQASIQDFIQEILDHIQAVLFVDPATGLLTLKLIRGDYDPDYLDEINPQNATLSNFGRKLWGEIINEIVVTWTNPENEQDETVTVQDLASIVTQGGIVSDGRNYYGVRSSALAQRLAQRDLRASGAPLASCEAEVDRTIWDVRPASVYSLTWPEYGLSGVIMRVTEVDYGKPGDSKIKLVLVEDVFGLDVGAYTEPPGTVWEDPASEPDVLDHTEIFTLPFFMAVNTSTAAFIDSPEYPEVLAGVLGSTDNVDTFNYELWDEIALPDSSLEWQPLATENVIGRATLVSGFDAEGETEFDEDTDLSEIVGQTSPTQGGFMLIGDGTEAQNEIALVTAVGATITVSRGVLDTVPRAWPAGTPVWFIDDETLYTDPLVRAAGEVVSYRMLTMTSQGQLDLADAPDVSYTLTERPWLPSRPANVTIDAVQFNSAITPVDMIGESVVPVSWANRNRLTEDSVVLSWTDADVTPEAGQTTTITVYGADGSTVLDTITGLSGTTHDIPLSAFAGEPLGLVVVSSSRSDADGNFASLQGHGIWVQVAEVTFDSTLVTFDSTLHTMDEG